ncbi:MAG: hypothetical protein HKL92_06800 [Candidatus Eremiobacteraeota bacterium]|nr:hypothetical protein [Candidatus Eremiobacteraeota bacterium]
MNPTLALFLRLTVGIAALFLVVIVAFAILKVAIVAAIIAAVVLGALMIWRALSRSGRLPTLR